MQSVEESARLASSEDEAGPNHRSRKNLRPNTAKVSESKQQNSDSSSGDDAWFMQQRK